MPTTNRGYPYETAADQPGWSLTGGSDGDMQILAQVIDADVTALAATVTSNAAAASAALAAHTSATTAVHGIANTANLVVTTDPRLSDSRTPTAHAASHAAAGSDPVTPAAIGAYPATGGVVGGDVTLIDDDLTVKKADGLNGWRARSSGGAVDFDTVGDVVVTAWGGANFTGSETARQRWHSGGITYGGVVTFGSTVYTSEQFVHNTDLYAKLGGKNDAEAVQFCGRMTAPGAPAAGTWDTGDVVIDSAGVWHLCTAGGTPGTWT